jgi:EAL domain-containing protein (putative c-di-GMP-specific phosphodiesterase class I)
VVAQGVESEAVAARLAEIDCDRMQGYFPGLPLSASVFAARFSG